MINLGFHDAVDFSRFGSHEFMTKGTNRNQIVQITRNGRSVEKIWNNSNHFFNPGMYLM